MTFSIEVAVATHRGCVRERNEDTVGVAGWTLRATEPAVLDVTVEVFEDVELVVADGLGGHAGGAEASTVAVSALFAAQGTLQERIKAADAAVHARGEEQPQLAGLATTLAGVQIHADGRVTVFHLGDSRVYRLIDGLLGLITDDDKHADGSLTQVLGGDLRMELEPHLYETELSGDTLLICSDGLSTVLEEDAIADAVSRLPLREAAAELLQQTLNVGAPDNVTLILCARLSLQN